MRGDRLRELRKNLGYSQESLAEILETHQRQIWRWENGETVPSGNDIARLSETLNVSSDYLLGLSDDPTPASISGVQLDAKERQVISAWRRGDRMAAMKVIANDE